jgi:hypothetical protein
MSSAFSLAIGVRQSGDRRTNKSLCLEGYGLLFHRHNEKTKHKLPNQLSTPASPPSRMARSMSGLSPHQPKNFLLQPALGDHKGS